MVMKRRSGKGFTGFHKVISKIPGFESNPAFIAATRRRQPASKAIQSTRVVPHRAGRHSPFPFHMPNELKDPVLPLRL